MKKSNFKGLILAVALVLLIGAYECAKIAGRNDISEKDFDATTETVSWSPFGPGKIPLEIFNTDEDELKLQNEENLEKAVQEVKEEIKEEAKEGKKDETKNFLESELDEETIRKAEKIADEDLLNGLNRILENNETLEDVFRAENINEFF